MFSMKCSLCLGANPRNKITKKIQLVLPLYDLYQLCYKFGSIEFVRINMSMLFLFAFFTL